VQVVHEELTENVRPADRSLEKSLDRSVAAAFSGPTRQPQHRHATAHAQHGLRNPAQTAQIGFC